jgi:hypothetical protein
MADPPMKSTYSLRARGKKAGAEEAPSAAAAAKVEEGAAAALPPLPKTGKKSLGKADRVTVVNMTGKKEEVKKETSGRLGAGAGPEPETAPVAFGVLPTEVPYEGLLGRAEAEGRNIVYPYLAYLTEREAEMIFTGGQAFAGLPSPARPFFVLLFGSPGSGKSSALARLPELIGLDPGTAVQINLDSLVESVEPFRAITHKIAQNELKDRGMTINTANTNTIEKISQATFGPYVSFMRLTKNNRPKVEEKETVEPEGGKKSKSKKPAKFKRSLNEIRLYMLEKALEAGKNIIYERTVSRIDEDILKDEVFNKIPAKYQVFIIYTKIDDVGELQRRLASRPKAMMKRNPPFFRGVAPSMAESFIRHHEEYFRRYLLQLQDEGKQILVVPADGSAVQYYPPKPESGSAAAAAATATSTSTSTGNARRGGNRKINTRKRKGSHGRKTRRC